MSVMQYGNHKTTRRDGMILPMRSQPLPGSSGLPETPAVGESRRNWRHASGRKGHASRIRRAIREVQPNTLRNSRGWPDIPDGHGGTLLV
jgi:hypothetical protein